MAFRHWFTLGLMASVLTQLGCGLCRNECGERRGLFGWRERARDRELAKERERDLDPTRPRLGDPVPPSGRDSIPPPEIPVNPRDSRYLSQGIGPSPGSWVGPPIESRSVPKAAQLDLPPWPSEVQKKPTDPGSSRPLPGELGPIASGKKVLEPDPLPTGPSSPPPLLDIPLELPTRSATTPRLGLEDPIRPQSIPTGPMPTEVGSASPAGTSGPMPTEERISESLTKPKLEQPIRPNFQGSSSALPSLFTVPGFKDVYTGRKPGLEGFDQLKSNSVRTVVYLHAPKADLSAPRQLAENAGLTFEPIEVRADRLREASAQFTESIKDSNRRPVFVYDDTGVRAGVVWYLHFRNEQQFSDEVAKVRANALGLGNRVTAEDAQLWNAAQSLTR